ncbi:thioesterase family protein [Pelagibius sp. Alg239-R121]|uniref:acyl-CoA thioesterase n=1 Tax=Pelagibius sp. Alg239-R121 TaxID=2993448 RepID=UPI0024A741DF|nr:thioesterase family protein [Pelagibius sp. Alg239-R121]
MAAFETRQKVMFQHCDPAGIVFYPRYVEMINAVVEEWFECGLDLPFSELVVERGEGVPTAHLEVSFKAPSRLGEELLLSLAVTKLGSSSVICTVDALCRDELRFTSSVTLVHIDGKRMKSEPWPADLRARIQSYISQPAA